MHDDQDDVKERPIDCMKSEDNAATYEWATWRMYHRIVEHRLSQRSLSSTSTCDAHPSPRPSEIAPQAFPTQQPSAPEAPPREYEGEVFEMEI
jgi:hypothetical protein